MSASNPRNDRSILHACRVCVTGRYASEHDRDHSTFCGRRLTGSVGIRAADGDGSEALRGATCAECLMRADEWLQQQPPDWSA